MTDVFSDRIPKAGAEIFFAAPVEADSREGYFRKILDELPAAIYVTDALGRITYFNEAAATLVGPSSYRRDERMVRLLETVLA